MCCVRLRRGWEWANALTLTIALSALLTAARVSAEPILGEESLNIPTENTPQRPQTADALALFKARDYDGSYKLWQEAVRKNPDLPPASVIMAQLFLRSDMFKDARIALGRAATETPDDPEIYLLQAVIAMRDRDLDKAKKLYQKAEALLPAFGGSGKRKEMLAPQVYRGFAGVAEAGKDWVEMRKMLEKQLILDPKNVAAIQRLAYCLFQEKNVDGALKKLREAAKIDPNILTPEAALSQFYQMAGDHENVKKWMDAAIVAAPKNMKTRLAAGQLALETGQLEEARKHSLMAIRLDPQARQTRFFRGAIAMFEKDYEAAEAYFESALKQAPDDFGVRNNLAVALIQQPDEAKHRRALEIAEANAKQFPKMSEAASTYAWVLYTMGRLDDAEKAIRGAASVAATDLDVAYIMARIAIDRRHHDEAKQVLEVALKNKAPALFQQEAKELFEKLQQK